MKNIIKIMLLLVLFQACELADVQNPNVTNDKFTNSPQATDSWMNGARRQMATTLSTFVELGELTSDNYFNNRTLSSKVFDIPQIAFTDIDVLRMQSEVQSLRRSAEFGLEEVLPKDARTTDDDRAELFFYKGVAHLFSAEYFVGLPAVDRGPVETPDFHFQRAREDFEQAISLSSADDLRLAAQLAIARIYYHQGDRNNAMAEAMDVIGADPLLNFQITYDGVNGPSNQMQFFLFDSSQDEFAPLPRLDFLDPKYFSVGSPELDQKPISLFKAEEAYFIVAEARLAGQDLEGAKATLRDLLSEVIANRPTVAFDDSRETRSGGNRDDYPLSDTVRVRFEAGEPAREGLILDRQKGPVTVATVSGTQVTEAEIDAAASADELLELIYLMRQEVFIAEGRRVIDLGIRFPVAENEARNNSNIDEGSEFLQPIIPDFIPGDQAMDDFTVDEAAGILTMTVNMNRILVENQASPLVIPFQ